MGNSFFFGSPRERRLVAYFDSLPPKERAAAQARYAMKQAARFGRAMDKAKSEMKALLAVSTDRQIASFRRVLEQDAPHRLGWFDMLARADQVRVSTPLRRERSDDQKDYAECAYERDGSNPHEYPW